MPIRKILIPRIDRIVNTEKIALMILKYSIALSIGAAKLISTVNTTNEPYP